MPVIMGKVIIGKNRDDIIKTLKKLGEIVVLAKAEIIYAFRPDFFPNITTEEIMEEIKKKPQAYKYYRVGLLKITEIKEVKNEELLDETQAYQMMEKMHEVSEKSDVSKVLVEKSEDLMSADSELTHKEVYRPKRNIIEILKTIEPFSKKTLKINKLGKPFDSIPTRVSVDIREAFPELYNEDGTAKKGDKIFIGSGSINDQHEFNGEEKLEDKKKEEKKWKS